MILIFYLYLSISNTDIWKKIVNNTTLSTLSDDIDEQFTVTTTERSEYTDQEVEALRKEGYI